MSIKNDTHQPIENTEECQEGDESSPPSSEQNNWKNGEMGYKTANGTKKEFPNPREKDGEPPF